jgi:hypothetical protein
MTETVEDYCCVPHSMQEVHQVSPDSILMPAGIPGIRISGSAAASTDEAATCNAEHESSFGEFDSDPGAFMMTG